MGPEKTIAIAIMGGIIAVALLMHLRELRWRAKRRAEGRDEDITKFFLFGSSAVIDHETGKITTKADDTRPLYTMDGPVEPVKAPGR